MSKADCTAAYFVPIHLNIVVSYEGNTDSKAHEQE